MSGVIKLRTGAIHYNLIDLKDYAIVSVRKVSLLKGGK